jgi:mitochondrial GTPase 1
MPNVGKSTFLNAFRKHGIKGTKKAFQTSNLPGKTRAVSNVVKVLEHPLIYALDTPGVMVPYLGRGAEGAERGVKLALTSEYFVAGWDPSRLGSCPGK